MTLWAMTRGARLERGLGSKNRGAGQSEGTADCRVAQIQGKHIRTRLPSIQRAVCFWNLASSC